MTQKEVGKLCLKKGLYEKVQTLCAFSNGQIHANGNLESLQAQAALEGVEFFLLKGEIKEKSKKDKDNGSADNNV